MCVLMCVCVCVCVCGVCRFTHPLYCCSTHRFATALHAALFCPIKHALAEGPSNTARGADGLTDRDGKEAYRGNNTTQRKDTSHTPYGHHYEHTCYPVLYTFSHTSSIEHGLQLRVLGFRERGQYVVCLCFFAYGVCLPVLLWQG